MLKMFQNRNLNMMHLQAIFMVLKQESQGLALGERSAWVLSSLLSMERKHRSLIKKYE